MAQIITAHDNRTGQSVEVPDRWLKHPVLGEHLSKTPSRPARATPATTATTTPAAGDPKE